MARAKGSRRPAWESLGPELPSPQEARDAEDLLWREFCAQFRWYDSAATRARRAHQGLRILTLGCAAAVTVLAALAAPAPLAAGLGALIVLVEGLAQIGQFHAKWLNYRGTTERMRHEGFFYAAGAGGYSDPGKRRARLARFIDDALGAEHAAWAQSTARAAEHGQR